MSINSRIFNDQEYSRILLAVHNLEQKNNSTYEALSEKLGYNDHTLITKKISYLRATQKKGKYPLFTTEPHQPEQKNPKADFKKKEGRPTIIVRINWSGYAQILYMWCCGGKPLEEIPPPSKELIDVLRKQVIKDAPRHTLNESLAISYHSAEIVFNQITNIKPETKKEWLLFSIAYHVKELSKVING